MKYEVLQQWVDEAQRIVFFGGAGVSTESGIPDFRSVDGLYNQKYDYPPEQMLSHTFFMMKPEEFFRFYRDKMLPLEAKPNAAHLKLAEWEKAGKMTGVVTQNIDGLHQAAGSKRVIELHGSVLRNKCVACGRSYPLSFITERSGVPLCTACHGIVKPEVVLYEEPLNEQDLIDAGRALYSADLLIVGGTSLTVNPAAGLVNYFRGNEFVIINRDPTPYDRAATRIYRDPIGRLLGEAVSLL
jgi:NAD-dependent deacetylase